ncbi:hypothetical protein [Nocardia sp. NPDC006630]|uniref:Acg family FMN-binding oxidoreductase n=1 Tax=Nocardia sp. NPDC006630 TaxID=3157181 RepID=UPI00339E6323
MAEKQLDMEIFESAIALAVRAPSVHNTQPWRWRLAGGGIDLHADRTRQLNVSDPTQRELLLSCGAALHHLRVALAVHGMAADVTHLPDPADPDHLAHIAVTPQQPTGADIDLAAAVLHRQSDRRRYGSRPVHSRHLRQVAVGAAGFGAVAREVPPTLRATLARTTRIAADRHAANLDYLGELSAWSGRTGANDGVPARNSAYIPPSDEIRQRKFVQPMLTDPAPAPDASAWLVLCTPADDRRAQLRAGEAASALLLTATELGLSTCLQTEPIEMPDLRAAIRAEVLFDCAYPQTLVRLGWPSPAAAPLPLAPRREPADVIDGYAAAC